MIYDNSIARVRRDLNDFVNESPTAEGQFIGAEIMPEHGIDDPAGGYLKITIAEGDLMRAAQSRRAPGAGFVRSQAGFSAGTLTLTQYGEELTIPDEHEKLYDDYLSLEEFYTVEGRNKLLRLQEILVQGQIQNPANFQVVNATVPYLTANKATNSFVDDITGLFRLLRARGQRANTIVIPSDVFDRVRVGTLTQAFIAGVNAPGATVNTNTIQKAFMENGITKVLIGEAVVNQSINNDDTQILPIWSPAYIWVGHTQGGPLQAGGAGRTYFWKKEGPLLNVMSYRDEPKRSNVIRVMTTQQPTVTNARAGVLLATGYVA